MADLGKEEVPYSADDYLPSSPPSLDKRRKLAASESSPPGANRSPSDVRTSRAADEDGEVLDDRDSKRRRNDSAERRYDDRDRRREDRSRRSVERDDHRHRGERDRDHGRRKEREHGNGHHDRKDRRDDYRRERSHSRDRDRDRDSERGHRSDKSEKDKERDRHGEHRERDRSDRGRERDQREHRGGGDRDKGSNRESRDKRKDRSPPLPPAAAPPPLAPVEYVLPPNYVLTYDRSVVLLNVEIKSQEEKEEEERCLIEERRKRRQELLSKLQQQQAGPAAPVDAAPPTTTTTSLVGPPGAAPQAANATSPVAAPTTPPKADEDMFGEMSMAEKERLEKEKARVEAEEQQRQEREEEAQAEADRKALEKLWASSAAAAAPAAGAPPYDEVEEMKEEVKEELEEAEFDMFVDSPSKLTDKVVPLKVLVERREQNPAMIDNWDDGEGYYKFRIGEVLADRYVVFNAYGKGVFSSVVRAKDLQNSESEVAIKLIRNNDVMYKAGQKELMILGLIRDADPENKRHCIRLLHHFEFRNHLCLVMEPLAMNLREVIRKYGKDVGLNITAVKLYAKQMFIALRHLRKCNIIHADIKPDNILVNETKTTLKLCDFGSASLVSENEITPYLVSRFYRAPEIILGCPYDFALDMWSIGCCLVELYTGKILFEKGRTNNQMLRLMMEMRGKIPNKMLKKAMPMIRAQHFDDDLNFINKTVDPVTKKETAKPLQIMQPTRDLGTILNVSTRYLAEKDQKEVMQFKDLLERIFTFETVKRITPKEALQHPFITGILPAATKK